MTDRRKICLAGVAVLLTCLTIAAGTRVTGTISVPVFVGLFTLGPFALALLVLPAVAYPLLVATCPLTKPRIKRAIAVAAVPLAASGIYLHSVSTIRGGREESIAALSVVVLVLAVLAGVALLRESDIVTLAFHAVLVAWFFGFSFPYLGEVP
jgi:hypothetical protein